MAEPSVGLLALVEHANLDSISFIELSARRGPVAEGRSGGPRAPTYMLTTNGTDDGSRFRIALRVDLELEEGEVQVTAQADYTVAGPGTGSVTRHGVVEYANEVGIMTLLPYLRQAIADLTQRVFDTALLMPVQPRGAVSFPLPNEE